MIDNLDYLDNKKIINNGNMIEFVGQAIEKYIFGDEKIANVIIYSKGIDLSRLSEPDLFIKKDFNKLNSIIQNFKFNIEPKNYEEKYKQNSERVNPLISVAKMNMKKCGNVKMYTYSDLNISSTDLWI